MRHPSSRTGNYTLHTNSRSEVNSVTSNSPRKFLHLQGDYNNYDSSIINHKLKNSVYASTQKVQNSVFKSEFSPSKAAHSVIQTNKGNVVL